MRTVGVCPQGAHEHLSGETSEKPLSSTTTSVARRLCHFFYLRPEVAPPVRHRRIVTRQGPALGSLATPVQTPHHMPNATGMIPDGEELPIEVQPFRKYCLLNGFDDIGLTLRQADKIRAFEANRLAQKPWLARTLIS